ncbi:restriction endonuclease subunit M [Blastomonas marina]|uniref:DNA (cytosine-5-)-methyltransferase n=1 Tax=Blastomonas marina TaxID=1867408 RepID=A0ABQ1F3Z9_9SPHN|nr:DNA cytosine methyltransferase [Blastomonas marina]GFZ98703.1 restriction endonuclease subunit M [Blastomonas marina]
MKSNRVFRTIDLFAGPGGLAEGFSTSTGPAEFKIDLSVEMDAGAFSTLRLRSFYRNLDPSGRQDYIDFANGEIPLKEIVQRHGVAWEQAEAETAMLELGKPDDDRKLDVRLDKLLEDDADNFVVIGGPPCQAYSLAGRSRNAGNADYTPEKDRRHFLFREYIRILDKVRPRAFVMENVKGILSSSVSGGRIFELIHRDLANAAGPDSYRLFSLSPEPDKSGYLLRAEEHGVPQARHRVIILGLRQDVAASLDASEIRLPKATREVSVEEAIGDLPELRSGLSRGEDNFPCWKKAVGEAFLAAADAAPEGSGLRERLWQHHKAIQQRMETGRSSTSYGTTPPSEFVKTLRDDRLIRPPNHETRGHMTSDLARYAFCATFAELEGRPPSSRDFPEVLAPNHQSWNSGKFADRFKVQVWNRPSSTVTSHISKDGHYFIHPDPTQCRSLTVREAARLQSFPDDYVFLGNRTSQYVQVGNAVPPVLARQIALVLGQLLAGGIKQARAA